jgi:DNA polymerase III epsilon subunit-like protein
MIQKKLAFIDIETTGIKLMKHEIIEIGCLIAVQYPDGSFQVKEEFEIKVKPERIEDADIKALRINGYSADGWLFAHSKQEAMQMLALKTESAVMVAHNVGFDYSFIQKAFEECGIENKMFYANIDTLTLAIAKLKDNEDVGRYTLRAMCEHFGIKNERAHTALADVRATFELFKKLMQSKT